MKIDDTTEGDFGNFFDVQIRDEALSKLLVCRDDTPHVR